MTQANVDIRGLLFGFIGSLIGGFFAILLLYGIITYILNILNKKTSKTIKILASIVIALLLSRGELIYLVDGMLVFLFLKRTKQ